jgi:hypothetical protein
VGKRWQIYETNYKKEKKMLNQFQQMSDCENDPPTEQLTTSFEKNDLEVFSYHCDVRLRLFAHRSIEVSTHRNDYKYVKLQQHHYRTHNGDPSVSHQHHRIYCKQERNKDQVS